MTDLLHRIVTFPPRTTILRMAALSPSPDAGLEACSFLAQFCHNSGGYLGIANLLATAYGRFVTTRDLETDDAIQARREGVAFIHALVDLLITSDDEVKDATIKAFHREW